MSTISGFIAVHPDREPNIHNVARRIPFAWDNICSKAQREKWESEGWRVVPCRLVVEDGKDG